MKIFKMITASFGIFFAAIMLSLLFNADAEAADSHGAVCMYRLFNPKTGEHLFTKDLKEKNYLDNNGWDYEDIAWYAPRQSLTPVYRLFNADTGEHLYTTGLKERNYLIEHSWKDEGIGWYSSDSKAVPLYRIFNPAMGIGAHHYTISRKERDYQTKHGWSAEGTAWYGMEPDDAKALIAQEKKGSLGFFEEVGATEAVRVLKEAAYSSYTEPGALKDATDLDNMKAAIDRIDECNKLRGNLGIDPLTVSDYMMAVAQSNANASAYILKSTSQFNVGENPSWGYNNPFNAWYTAEKRNYDAGITDYQTTGHYQNIINSSYTLTGYAVTQYGKYKKTDIQVFQYRTKGFSASEYRARFMKYYNKYR